MSEEPKPWAPPARLICDCGGDTLVVNTRGREDCDVVWRQRRCKLCERLFSTFESRENPSNAASREAALRQLDAAIARVKKCFEDLQPHG